MSKPNPAPTLEDLLALMALAISGKAANIRIKQRLDSRFANILNDLRKEGWELSRPLPTTTQRRFSNLRDMMKSCGYDV